MIVHCHYIILWSQRWREGETDRLTEKDIQTDGDRHTDSQTDRQRGKQTVRQTHKVMRTGRQRESERDKKRQ